ncbi:MAG: hypothetical protein BGO68_04730 [Candidatus Amoebophilus sp. 36-38]|nr:MAG: hypothetical protein BGO68_04730 [Candidatus Amoebophilus sp. 36-38]
MGVNIIYLRSILGRLFLFISLVLVASCDGDNSNVPKSTNNQQDQREDMEVELETHHQEQGVTLAGSSQPSTSHSNWLIPYDGSANQNVQSLSTPNILSSTAFNNSKRKRNEQGEQVEKKKQPNKKVEKEEVSKKRKKSYGSKNKETQNYLNKREKKEQECADELSLDKFLPDETIAEIFSHVGFPDIVKCMLVNKHWYDIIRCNANYIGKSINFKDKILNFHNRLPWNPQDHDIERNLVFKFFTRKVKDLPLDLLYSLAGTHTQIKELDWSISFPSYTACKALYDDQLGFLAEALEKHPHIKSLNLANNQLTLRGINRLLTALPQLRMLEVLNLSDNILTNQGISFLPFLMNALKDSILKTLNLSNTGLTANKAQALIATFSTITLSQLPWLEELDLSDNEQLSGGVIEIVEACPNLKRLYLSNTDLTANEVQALTTTLSQIPQLEELDLSNNRQLSGSVIEIVKVCPNLKRLYLCNIDLTANEAQALTTILPQLSQLKLLDLSDNRQLSGRVIEIVEVCPNLKRLYLNNIDLTANEAQALTTILPQLSQLKLLDLSDNPLDNEGIVVLCEGLKKISDLNLKLLKLDGIDFDLQSARALIETLSYLPKLRHFYLHFIRSNCAKLIATNKDVSRVLGKSLRKLPNLKELDLPEKLNDESMTSLADGFLDTTDADSFTTSPNLKLEVFRISFSDLGLEGVHALAKILPYFPNLKILDLRGNTLNDEGIAIILNNLTSLNLEELRISLNDSGLEGVRALAKIFPHFSNLKILGLRGYTLNDEGIAIVLNSLKSSLNLKNLYMEGLYLSLEGTEALADVLPHLSRLKELFLSYDNPSNELVNKILDGLKERKTTIYWIVNYTNEEVQARLKQNFPNIKWSFHF